jgi:molybdopterin-guanine dinucleotide biosynthesis protein A
LRLGGVLLSIEVLEVKEDWLHEDHQAASMIPFSIAICAGGKSSRMGTDKAFVELLGQPLVKHLLDRLKTLGHQEIFLIANHTDSYESLGLPIYKDRLPMLGALGGIYTALYYSHTPYTLILACDMPFVSTPLLAFMLQQCSPNYDVVVPLVNNRFEGMHAIYNKACLEPAAIQLEKGELKVGAFLQQVRTHIITEEQCRQHDSDGLTFFNINTPEQLDDARRLATSKHQTSDDESRSE